MSTDYSAICNKCKKRTLAFSHQAWGSGNVWASETFLFMLHHSFCGIENLKIVIEQSEGEDYDDEVFDEKFDDYVLGGFIQDVENYKEKRRKRKAGGE